MKPDPERFEEIVTKLTQAYIIEGNFGARDQAAADSKRRAIALALEIMAETDRRWPRQH